MRFPWRKRLDAAKAQTEKAQHEYEWAVQNRTLVRAVVERLTYHATENGFVEKIQRVARGH